MIAYLEYLMLPVLALISVDFWVRDKDLCCFVSSHTVHKRGLENHGSIAGFAAPFGGAGLFLR